MSDEMSDDAARLAAHPRFVLAAGMLLTDGVGVAYRVHHDGFGLAMVPNIPAAIVGPARPPEVMTDFARALGLSPVLSDAATAGCLQAMLGDDYSVSRCHRDAGDLYRVVVSVPWHVYSGPTLGHACAAALLAVWGP